MNLLNKIVLSGVLLSTSAAAEIVAHWTLDNSLLDSSGNGYHLLQSQNDSGADVVFLPETNTGSMYSQSAYFGAGAHLATPLSADEAGIAEGFSFSLWFNHDYMNRTSSGWSLLDFDRSENFLLAPRSTGGMQFALATDSVHDYVTDENLINDGAWHHVFASYGQKDGLSVYLDGDLLFKDIYSGVLKENQWTTRYALLGQGSESSEIDGHHNNAGYTGYLSDVIIWNNEVDDHEAAALDLMGGGNYLSINEIEYIKDVPAPFMGSVMLGLLFFRRKMEGRNKGNKL